MSVQIDMAYEGDLRCSAVHGPSGDRLVTDASIEDEGQGRHFSPTDLFATSLGTCILTIMGTAASKRGLDISGARVTVVKEIATKPRRRIATLTAHFTLPASLDQRSRRLMEALAEVCPVTASLHPDTKVVLRFDYR